MTETTGPGAAESETIIRREGRAGRITLNRPKALNALTWNMVRAIQAALDGWRNDAAVEVVILDGAGDRGLCAGGDVRWLYDMRRQGLAEAAAFWREEYILNADIARYPKPFVAVQDGIVMGGGIGLSAHARHRIVTERSQLAMPETTIGLIPDVGGTWLLSRAQGRLGTYLGLTGARMDASDAIQAGFAGSYVPTSAVPGLLARLCDGGPETIEEIIEDASEPVPPSKLAAARPMIDRLFAFDTVAAIREALNTTTDELARKAHTDLATRSPKALALTLEAIRRAKSYRTLEEALTVEYRLCNRLYADGEFIEGVRALLVDKDKQPRWSPARIEDVTPTIVADHFAPRPAAEEIRWRA
jgi:enoyl-CoA hydratase